MSRIAATALCLASLSVVQADSLRPAYAAISGVVLNDASGAPLHRVVVTLSTVDPPLLEAVTFSESTGAFGFTAIPPGKYHLTASLDGFQTASFGAATPARAPGTLTLAAGDVRFGVTFRLRPLGSIAGVIYDPDGEPLPNVQVRLLKAGWSRRKPSYEREAFANSDQRGRYRFPEVLPGHYIIMASQPYANALLMQPDVAPGQVPPSKAYGVTFFPDALKISAATPVEAAPGKDLDNIDFHLAPRLVASVHGRITFPDEAAGDTTGLITVFPQDVPDSDEQTMAMGANAPKFDFNIENLVPGAYWIDARVTHAGHDCHDAQRIELSSGGQEVTFHPECGIDLQGRLDIESADRPAAPFKVSLVPAGYPPGRNAIQAEVQPDGAFVVSNLTAGTWDIDASPVPPGGYIKAMRLGDRDVLTEDMTIDSGTRDPLHIVISGRGAVVSGTVTVPAGVARSPRARILLAPSGPYADVLSFYAETGADDAGHFEFKGVTPGRYKLYAFEEMQSSAYDDPNFLKPFEPLSEAFDIAEGALVERKTQLIVTGMQPAEGR
ncbi:MAG: carboxypeptidase regulatory-like domain-containing protein [Bryobacteraceae bacterium]